MTDPAADKNPNPVPQADAPNSVSGNTATSPSSGPAHKNVPNSTEGNATTPQLPPGPLVKIYTTLRPKSIRSTYIRSTQPLRPQPTDTLIEKESQQPDENINKANENETQLKELCNCQLKQPSPPELCLLECVTHFILKRCQSPIDIGVPYSDDALKFDVFDQDGIRFLVLCEATKYCPILCWKTDRTFQFHVMDTQQKLLFKITRACSCCCFCGVVCCGDMCCNGVTVSMEDGSVIGSVSQKFRLCKALYVVKDAIGKPILRISGPTWGFCCPCRMCCDAHFSIKITKKVKLTKKCCCCRCRVSKLPVTIGELKPGWIEFSRVPAFQFGDNFGASFPSDLDVKVKATILGALILIEIDFNLDSQSDDKAEFNAILFNNFQYFLHFGKDPCSPSQFLC